MSLLRVVLPAIFLFALAGRAHAVLGVTALNPSPPLPQVYGTPITWTATVTGAVGPIEYQFFRYSIATGNWSSVRAYSASNQFSWTPSAAEVGTYALQVWVRAVGSPNTYDAWRGTANFTITDRNPTVTALTANVVFPRLYGTAIRWTATVSGGLTPLYYRFWRYSYASNTWSIVQDYSTTSTYTWTPTAGDLGRYSLQVWVRNSGSSTSYDAWKAYPAFDIIGPAPRITGFSANQSFPMHAGIPVTFTATATGGVAPLQYQFWLYRSSTASWSIVQPYSANRSWTWTPVAADVGTYFVQIWVRNNLETVPYDVWQASGAFDITAPLPLSITQVNVAPGVPRPVTSVLQWTAATTGGVQPIQYKFWRYSTATGWTVVQDWSGAGFYSWTTTAADAGNYSMQVWARSAGSTATYDAWLGVPTFTVTPPTSDLVRFLEQASFGPSDELIEHVRQVGMSAWIDEQFIAPLSGYAPLPAVPDDVPATCDPTCQRDNYTMYPLQNQFFFNSLYGEDQLRQRVAWALHQLFVVSGDTVTIPSWFVPYLNIVYQGAFGNYRDLLYNITLNPAMGEYLNMNLNTRQNPNENFAREILQLFSTGTDLLYPDGTPQLNLAGVAVPSYDQYTVTQFARVFTGWRGAADLAPGFSNYLSSMQIVSANHDTGAKTLLRGTVLPAGQTPNKDLGDALDNIFNHPNVGPFIAKHLIRQLVTSNPTPAYVGRVAAAFNNNGIGVRGDLRAVVKAVLLDAEARRTVTVGPYYGKFKEPALYVTNVLRALNAKSANLQVLSDGYLNPQTKSVNQDVFNPPTVFNYYPADYLAPKTFVLGPEFGTVTTVTALRRANVINQLVFTGIPVSANSPVGTALDYSGLLPLASNTPTAMIKEIDRIMMHDTMSPAMSAAILTAVTAVPSTNPLLRVQTAVYLVATSSQYQVEK